MNKRIDFKLKELSHNSPEKIAFSDGAKLNLTYSQIEILTSNIIKSIKEQTRDGNAFIGILLPHGIPQALLILACLRENICGICLNVSESQKNILSQIRNLRVTHLITLENLKTKFHSLFDETSLIKRSSLNFDICYHFTSLCIDKTQKDLPLKDSWSLLTSGSTGSPKAVLISNDQIIQRSLEEINYLEIKNLTPSLNCLSFNHDVGFTQLISNVFSAHTIYICPFMFPSQIVNLLKSKKCQSIWGTPYIWRRVLSETKEQEVISPYLKMATISAGSLSIMEQKALANKLPGAKVFRTFGQTETFRTFYSEKISDEFDRTLPHSKIKLVGPDSHPVTLGETGELIHYDGGIAQGYISNTSHTSYSNSVTTGDFFQEISKGVYKFCGRKDDLLKNLDQRFFAEELSNPVIKEFNLEECYVYVSPKDYKLVLAVESKEEDFALSQKIHEFCRSSFPLYKVPSVCLIIPIFPRTETGKTKKMELQNLCESLRS